MSGRRRGSQESVGSVGEGQGAHVGPVGGGEGEGRGPVLLVGKGRQDWEGRGSGWE